MLKNNGVSKYFIVSLFISIYYKKLVILCIITEESYLFLKIHYFVPYLLKHILTI